MHYFTTQAVILGILLISLGGTAPSGCERNQGIQGRILFESGNQMPGPGVVREPAKGVQRELRVYPVLHGNQLQGEGNGFYDEPAHPPVKTVTSDTAGYFRVQLPPGEYSLLVQENDRLYANRFDGEGRIFPVKVEAGKMTEVEFKINYAAAY